MRFIGRFRICIHVLEPKTDSVLLRMNPETVSESFQLTFSRFNLNPVTLESHSLAVLWDKFVIKQSSKQKHNNFRRERKKAFCLPDTTAIKNFSEIGCFVS